MISLYTEEIEEKTVASRCNDPSENVVRSLIAVKNHLFFCFRLVCLRQHISFSKQLHPAKCMQYAAFCMTKHTHTYIVYTAHINAEREKDFLSKKKPSEESMLKKWTIVKTKQRKRRKKRKRANTYKCTAHCKRYKSKAKKVHELCVIVLVCCGHKLHTTSTVYTKYNIIFATRIRHNITKHESASVQSICCIIQSSYSKAIRCFIYFNVLANKPKCENCILWLFSQRLFSFSAFGS